MSFLRKNVVLCIFFRKVCDSSGSLCSLFNPLRCQLPKIISVEKLSVEIEELRGSLSLRVKQGDQLAMAGADFILEAARRDLATDKTGKQQTQEEQLMETLLNWARLVCANYGIEVKVSSSVLVIPFLSSSNSSDVKLLYFFTLHFAD